MILKQCTLMRMHMSSSSAHTGRPWARVLLSYGDMYYHTMCCSSTHVTAHEASLCLLFTVMSDAKLR